MIKLHSRSHDNVLGFEVSGKINFEDLKHIELLIEEKINKYDKINWMLILNEGLPSYTSLRAFYEDSMWMFKHLKHFDKMAVVGNSTFAKILFNIDGFFFGEKYFDITDIEKAWAYVEDIK